MKTRTLQLRHSINRSCCPLALLLVPLALACLSLSPTARAVTPAPECPPNFNARTGCHALYELTTGVGNAALGWHALAENSDASFSTAIGAGALSANNGESNTAVGAAALLLNTAGTTNTAVGTAALVNNGSGNGNTAHGAFALYSNVDGGGNTAIGREALTSNTDGSENVAIGDSALLFNTTGADNIAIGFSAMLGNFAGNNNIAIGVTAGINLTGDNNIDIGNEGVSGEANTIRIGGDVGFGAQTATYIAAISGVAVVGDPVVVDANGQLGTATSSARFKKEVKPMEKASEAILALKPVTFRYKKEVDPQGAQQWGLVAEDVEKVNPDLVVRDNQGKPYSVRYDQVNAMLLNEFLKEHKKVEKQQATIAELKSTVAQQQKGFQSRLAQQQKQLEALTSGLQKVSAQLEASKPAPQVVNNP
jgi:uncharacterized coiled-coil protein SlyX